MAIDFLLPLKIPLLALSLNLLLGRRRRKVLGDCSSRTFPLRLCIPKTVDFQLRQLLSESLVAEAAQVIEELIAMAKQFRDDAHKAKALGLSEPEIAFYDALAHNQSAQELMGDDVLMSMARELAVKLRGNLSIDWQYKENVRARLRTMIKALLKRYKYPPDQESAAIELVLQQTELISEEWARQDLGNQIQAVVADVLSRSIQPPPSPSFS
ncbi:MAG: DUF3387 domain-containing protein [Cyanobium sp. M30B3]|nr:MAG: DUF3387 domain-containing protein [Cyanobium sp. M30B3]